jgi:hypothetical protein
MERPTPEMDWMGGIEGNTRVSGIIMPGSHDAGVPKDDLKLNYGLKGSWAACQYGSITKQAEVGSRFFDCRVFYQAQSPELDHDHSVRLRSNNMGSYEEFSAYRKKGVDDVTKSRFRFGHFARERTYGSKHGGAGGAYGGRLKTAILEALQFLKDHPTEFLILRFSHSGWPDKLGQVMRHWVEKYGWHDAIYRAPNNIASEFLENLRGKLVMVFDGQHTNLDPGVGLHPFAKFEDTRASPATGLATCGVYANSSKLREVVGKALEAAEAHFPNHDARHLHFVYYQQTVTLKSIEDATTAPKGKKSYSGGARSSLGDFLGELRAMAEKSNVEVPRIANVISHDFVDPITCRQIIRLNKDINW